MRTYDATIRGLVDSSQRMKKTRNFTFALLLLSILSLCIPAAAKDEWIQIRSRNFLLIGNASEKDIRKVGTRLEEFRETFRRLFTKMSLASPVPINVVVFKGASSYNQFKPLLADGKIDASVAGYFQSGDDVNYITLSVEGEDAHTFGVIFHEYVHSIVKLNFEKADVPPWFNEGLAEYYETFTIENDQKVKVGLPQARHLALLQKSTLTPLRSLFNVTNFQLSNSDDRARDLFYAESWALVHYVIENGKSELLTKFLDLVLSGIPTEQAFQDAFHTSYSEMEKQLHGYVALNKYNYREFTFAQRLEFDTAMHVLPLNEVAVNSYLGDLLAHIHREADAEPYLHEALKLDPSSTMANTTLGMLRMRQRKFDEAKKYLESVGTGEQTNYRVLYDYAYLLSREGRDDLGYVRELPKEAAAKMRAALNKAIALNPSFTESYELQAFINLVNNDDLDNAADLMQKALKIQPRNENYAMRLAEIYLRMNKYAEAGIIVDKMAKTTDQSNMRQRAENLGLIVKQRQEAVDRQAVERKLHPDSVQENYAIPSAFGSPTENPMTEAEIATAKSDAKMRAVNQMLRQLKIGEKRVIGHLQKIECRNGQIAFGIKTATDAFTLIRKDFQLLELGIFVEATKSVQIGCDANLAAFNALVTFKPASAATGRDELVAVEFVPNDFRLMTAGELKQPPPRIVPIESVDSNGVAITLSPNGKPPDLAKLRRHSMLQGIKAALRQPFEGEKRDVGYLDKIECSDKAVFFHIRTATQTLRLLDAIPKSRPIQIFAPDLEGTRFDCSLSPVEFPAVFIYLPAPDTRAKTAGSITSIDFVPKSFVLD